MDIFQRSGRGGAGNFYSQKDIDETTKKSVETKDLEAQKPLDADPYSHATAAAATNGGLSRTGRGGAGNFSSPSSAQATSSSSSGGTTTTTTTPAASGPYRGRGGAGNFQAAAETSQKEAEGRRNEEERRKREELERGDGMKNAVEAAMPREPPKIHLAHIRGKGRVPTEPDMQG